MVEYRERTDDSPSTESVATDPAPEPTTNPVDNKSITPVIATHPPKYTGLIGAAAAAPARYDNRGIGLGLGTAPTSTGMEDVDVPVSENDPMQAQLEKEFDQNLQQELEKGAAENDDNGKKRKRGH